MKKMLLPLLLAGLLVTDANLAHAQCGLDIFIANDQSGSVGAQENAQSRDFILKLAQAHPLGTTNTQNRIAIAEFDHTYQAYSFPAVGVNYTTDMADILAYKNSVRMLSGGTVGNYALMSSFQILNQTYIPGRQVRKLLLVMTDASPSQFSASAVAYTDYVKAAGGIVAVLAIEDAVNISLLHDVASNPDLYFSSVSYDLLNANAPAIINSILSNACSAILPDPSWDLSASLNVVNCGIGSADYTINNISNTPYSGTLHVAFYNNNPKLAGSSLLAVDVQPGQSIAANGSQTYTFSNAAFQNIANVYAVVNLDTAATNALTPLPYNLRPRLADSLEQNPFNNISVLASATGCPTFSPQLVVSNTATNISCDKKVTYQVQVCNTGAVAALNVVPAVIPESSSFVLVSSSNNTSTQSSIAQLANPGGETATEGYDGYSQTMTFPTLGNSYTSAASATFKYDNLGSTFISNGVFYFLAVGSSSGVPPGSTIISAKLTAKLGPAGTMNGIKVIDAGLFGPVPNHAGDAWGDHPTAATVAMPGGPTATGPGALVTVDVTSIAQELVNQSGWTANSAMAFFWHGNKHIFTGSTPASTLSVTYQSPPNIAPGDCGTFTYVFQDTSPTDSGTFNASVGVTTTTTGAIILPDTNFTAGSNNGLYGYDGSLTTHTSDDVVMPATTGCTQTSQPITTSIEIDSTSICAGPGSYVTAIVTINNPNTEPTPAGITLHNLLQHLNLTGAGATFASEPYAISNGLQLAQSDILNPAYPNVTNALYNKNGAQQLEIYQLPSGAALLKSILQPVRPISILPLL